MSKQALHESVKPVHSAVQASPRNTTGEVDHKHAEVNPLWSSLVTHVLPGRGVSGASDPTPLQPKLTVGAPDDAYEQEADAVAERVMRMPAMPAPAVDDEEETPALQPKPLGRNLVQRLCTECDEEIEEQEGVPAVQANEAKANDGESNPASVESVVPTPGAGAPLQADIRSRIEVDLGVDLASVCVHNDASAQAATQSINAKAFTHKNHIYLGTGQSATDLGLMAHEATHVVQQGYTSTSDIVRRGGVKPRIRQPVPSAGNALIQRAVRETPQVYKQPSAQVAMVHLHGDERNALETARRMYGEYCANLVHLNNARRCVTVDIPGSTNSCTADPNRIFSSNTITEANAFNAPCSCPPAKRSVAAAELTAFRDTSLLPAIRNISTTPTTTLPIVAFHNNTTPGGLSIRSYRPGGGESGATETDPARLGGGTNPSIAAREDPDNFLLVTRPGDYSAFAGRRNVVLQSTSPTDDGSLSVALRSQRYINIEAQQKRFISYADAHFLTNKAMADEVFAHLGVSRHPCTLGAHEQADEGAIRAGQSEAPQGIASFFAGILRGIIRLLSEIVRVAGQLSTMPAPLPRETAPASLPRGCLTYADQAVMDARKGHWAGIVGGMSASDVVEWIIGRRTPPVAARREARRQMDCLLHAMRASAQRRGAAAPPRTGIVSGRRSFGRQRGIWERKFNFDRRAGRFDRVSDHARRTCGSLIHASDDKWDTGLARHRVCWNAPPLRRTTPPPIPSGARPLTDSERQAEILQASSAPGISRHHWGTDFDLFGVNPKDWEAGQTFADEYSWLMRNASQYGFIQSFTATSAFMGLGYIEERWHWSYYPIAQALLEYARSHQTQIETALIGRWGSGTQFSYIQRHWREYMFNVGERGVF